MALIAISCEEDANPLECSADLVCTEIFVTVQYAPKDSENNPLIFDSFYSHNLDEGSIYNYNSVNTANDEGNYLVITDQEIGDLISSGTTIRFIGEIDGEVVHEQDFLIGHDCCHVQLLEGPGLQD